MTVRFIVPDEYYHVYNRGIERRNIFEEERDVSRFLFLLVAANTSNPVEMRNLLRRRDVAMSTLAGLVPISEKLVHIGAYCLMPNHFHFLIREHIPGGLSKFMQKLGTGYTMYFNTKYDRSGALFQGKFKAKHVDSEEYLKYLFAYIHLNPLDLFQPNWEEEKLHDMNIAKAKRYLNGYTYSSYLDYCGHNRPERFVLQTTLFPEYFSERREFEEYIEDWIAYRGERF